VTVAVRARLRRPIGVVRLLGAVTLGVAPWLALPGPASALGACTYEINGTSLDAAASPDAAINVPVDSETRLSVSAPGPLGQIRVTAELWPVSVQVYEPPATTESAWTGTVVPADQGVTLQGLYRIVVDEDVAECPPSAGWVRLTGANPLTTIPGLVGLGAAAIGIGLLLVAIRGALSGGGSLVVAGLGGAMAGLGVLALAHQSGAATVGERSVVLWAAAPGLGAMFVTRAVQSLATRGSPASAGLPQTTGLGAGPGGPGTGGDAAIDVDWQAPVPSTAGGGAPVAAPSVAPVAGTGSPMATIGAAVEPTVAPPAADVGAEVAYPTKAMPPGIADGGAAPEGGQMAVPPEGGAMAEPPEGGAMAEPPEGGAMAEPPEGGVADPPRTSYARLEAPDAVVELVPFDLVVGLAAAPDPDVEAAPLVRPAWSVGDYTLTIQLLADGFERVDGGDDPWRVDCHVTAEDPYPEVLVTLRALPTGKPIRARELKALYVIEGQAMGEAIRPVAVVDSPARLAAVEPTAPKGPATLSTPRGDTPPDITIRIEHRDDEVEGTFLWQMLVRPGLDVHVSSNPTGVALGDNAPAFLLGLIRAVGGATSPVKLRLELKGIGNTIRDKVPSEFWTLFTEVAAAVAPAVPSVQILSAEPHIPWELAAFPAGTPPPDVDAPAFLGAQADIGRWVLGEPPPRVPPPATLEVRTMAVVWGVYPAAIKLEEAEAEADSLQQDFGAVLIDASEDPVLELLTRSPSYDAIHFAVHAQYGDPEAVTPAPAPAAPEILLADGSRLGENTVKGCEPFSGTPLVFLNACQIGNGTEVLGDYAGVAAAFLYAGAAGVVAPLWSVDDGIAREIGLRFYQRVFAGATPAAAIRQERASFLKSGDTASATFVAYQFYGHPALKVSRPG
jgi:hypothetical protein